MPEARVITSGYEIGLSSSLKRLQANAGIARRNRKHARLIDRLGIFSGTLALSHVNPRISKSLKMELDTKIDHDFH